MKTLSTCLLMLACCSAACAANRDQLGPSAPPQGGPNAEGRAQAQARDPDPAPASPLPATEPAKRPEDVSKSFPDDAVAAAAIEEGFQQWSSGWLVDRYTAGTAIATDRGFKSGTYLIRGVFSLLRGNAKMTVPFAAAFASSGNAAEGFRLSNLCYNTSGTTECSADGRDQENAAQSRAFLGGIVSLGLAPAMTSGSEACKKRYTSFGRPYTDCH